MKDKNGIFQKILVYSISVLSIVLFMLILTSGLYVKRNLPAGRQIEATLLQLEELTTNQSWIEAETKVELLDQFWNTIAPWLQISSEEGDIKHFGNTIKRLEGYIKGKNSSSALAEISSLWFIWENLGT